jgi:hypothetical protein
VADDLRELIARVGSSSRVTPVPAAPTRVVLRALAGARLSPLGAWHLQSADKDFILDAEKARSELRWAPRSSNVDALARAYGAYLEQWRRPRRAHGSTHVSPWRERALALARRLS